MALFSKLFGLGLVIAGIFIAVYWSVWLLTITVSSLSIHPRSSPEW